MVGGTIQRYRLLRVILSSSRDMAYLLKCVFEGAGCGGTRARSNGRVACHVGMLMPTLGHARYTQDSRFARGFARVSYPVAQAFVGSNPTPRTIQNSEILDARMHVGTVGVGRTMFSGPQRRKVCNVGSDSVRFSQGTV